MAEQTTSNVPQIRFKGFEGVWEVKTLGDLGSFKNGMNFGKEAMGHGNPFVNLQNVFGQFEVDDKKLELAESSSMQRREYNLLKGDVLFIRSSVKPEGVGETALITKTLMNTTYSGFIIRYRPEVMMSYDFNRIAYRTTVVRKQILANASRSANTNINQNALKRIALRIPCFEEQTQIGKYFREMDSLIGLHQRKHDKLVTLKKAMLQKMFPLPGANTPEIRFKGFSSPWGSIEMEKIGQTYSGLFGKTKDDFGRGVGRFVTYMGVFNNPVSNLNVTDAIGVDPSQNEVRKGDVLFTISSETPHEVGMSSVWAEDAENVYLNSFCFGFRPIPGLHSDFLAYVFRADEFRKRICILAQGISRYNISKTKVMKIPISIPNPAEQQKIGTYFRTLDELITKHAIQLQKLKQIKSACLAKMFV